MNWGKPSLAGAVVCPDCRKPLDGAPDGLRCAACGAAFPLREGVPELWPPSRRAGIEASLASFRAPHVGARSNPLLRALLQPNPVCDPGARRRHRAVREAMAGGLVVNLGSKSATWGDHVVNLDLVAPAGRPGGVDLLADIEKLPFADASVDGIICTHVLEHVADARACFEEIARVIKPGGMVYIAVPFLFPNHPDPLDRTRWTLDGLRYELRRFEETQAGVAGGPFSAYVSVMPTLVGSIFPGFYLFNAVRGCLGWILWPLKFLDYLACLSSRAGMAAAAYFFFGRRRA